MPQKEPEKNHSTCSHIFSTSINRKGPSSHFSTLKTGLRSVVMITLFFSLPFFPSIRYLLGSATDFKLFQSPWMSPHWNKNVWSKIPAVIGSSLGKTLNLTSLPWVITGKTDFLFTSKQKAMHFLVPFKTWYTLTLAALPRSPSCRNFVTSSCDWLVLRLGLPSMHTYLWPLVARNAESMEKISIFWEASFWTPQPSSRRALLYKTYTKEPIGWPYAQFIRDTS